MASIFSPADRSAPVAYQLVRIAYKLLDRMIPKPASGSCRKQIPPPPTLSPGGKADRDFFLRNHARKKSLAAV